GRRVGGAAGTGTTNEGDLGDRSGEENIGIENSAIAGQRVDPLLDACPAGIVDENERAAGLESPLHDLGYFEGVDFSCGAAEHREILARKVDQTAVDGAGAGHDPIRGNFLVGHAEMHLAVLSEQTEFLETAGIDKGIDAFTGR